ncbi:MAG: PIN domain-containing protein [Gemmatimonadetes bacterium]|nr:PIN domain-containing protein [Gemmatimonadota bacterium]
MRGLFVDTSAWYPLVNAAHRDHDALADELRRQIRGGAQIITTNLIVAETHALLLRRAGRQAALAFLESVRQSPNRVETVTPERTAAAISRWIEPFSDQPFSLADAASFAVMAELGIREALTLDRHFAAAGFVMLPHSG